MNELSGEGPDDWTAIAPDLFTEAFSWKKVHFR